MRVLIVGKGKSGKASFLLLKRHGYDVDFVNENVVNGSENELKNFNFDRLFLGLSFIVVSPGVSLDLYFFKEIKRRKIKIISELELGFMFSKGDIIAVTGTNGKTTTVSIINHILNGLDGKIFLGGNIGIPFCEFADKTKNDDKIILECSSFQLEKVSKFKPKIACILNVTPDHLNRHKTIKNYAKCKFKICKNLSENDVLILNADDEYLQKNSPKTKAKKYYFSTKKEVDGCYVKRGCIYFNDNQKKIKLLSLKDIKLVGNHNVSNVLCSVLSVYLLTKNTDILKRVNSFFGVEHRIEFVKKVNGVLFYNDSKATNIDSALVAINSFKNKTNLILGGSDKGYNFDEFFAKIPQNVENIAIIGQVRQKIAFSAKKYLMSNYKIFESFKEAVVWCYKKAKPNYIVLLSPACASFDMFSGYEERGCVFKKIVGEIYQDETIDGCQQKKT